MPKIEHPKPTPAKKRPKERALPALPATVAEPAAQTGVAAEPAAQTDVAVEPAAQTDVAVEPASQSAAAVTAESPLDYMLRVMRDPDAGNARRDAMAKAALSYLHARRPDDTRGETGGEDGTTMFTWRPVQD